MLYFSGDQSNEKPGEQQEVQALSFQKKKCIRLKFVRVVYTQQFCKPIFNQLLPQIRYNAIFSIYRWKILELFANFSSMFAWFLVNFYVLDFTVLWFNLFICFFFISECCSRMQIARKSPCLFYFNNYAFLYKIRPWLIPKNWVPLQSNQQV